MKPFTQLLCLLALTFISGAVAADAPKPMQVEIRELPDAISKITTSLIVDLVVPRSSLRNEDRVCQPFRD